MSSPKPARETERVTARACQAATHKHSLKTHGKPAPAPPDVKSSPITRHSSKARLRQRHALCSMLTLRPRLLPSATSPSESCRGPCQLRASLPVPVPRCRRVPAQGAVAQHACWHGVSDASAGKLTHTHLPAGHHHLHPGQGRRGGVQNVTAHGSAPGAAWKRGCRLSGRHPAHGKGLRGKTSVLGEL